MSTITTKDGTQISGLRSGRQDEDATESLLSTLADDCPRGHSTW